jgi:hypothetical protein
MADFAPMWIDENGVAHTAALPDPTEVMSADFRSSLDALAVRHRDALCEVVQAAEMQAYESDWTDLVASELHVGASAPPDLLQGRVTSAGDLALAIDQVVPRWRLDAIMALDDYLDDDLDE